jgi:hypothetical protein
MSPTPPARLRAPGLSAAPVPPQPTLLQSVVGLSAVLAGLFVDVDSLFARPRCGWRAVCGAAWAARWASPRGLAWVLGVAHGPAPGPCVADADAAGAGSSSSGFGGGGSGSGGAWEWAPSAGVDRSGPRAGKRRPPRSVPLARVEKYARHAACTQCFHGDGGPSVRRCAREEGALFGGRVRARLRVDTHDDCCVHVTVCQCASVLVPAAWSPPHTGPSVFASVGAVCARVRACVTACPR